MTTMSMSPPPSPIDLEPETESAGGPLVHSCLPKSALGAGRMACLLAAAMMVMGLGLLVASLGLPQEAPPAMPRSTHAWDSDALNHEWMRLRDRILPPDAVVLPRSPQAKALQWLTLALQQQQQQQEQQQEQQQQPLPHGSRLGLPERYALAVLYYATDGPHWPMPDASDGWNLTWRATSDLHTARVVDECQWWGVECAPHGTTVVSLQLAGGTKLLLQGTLPTELGLLTSMTRFGAADNRLQGALPRELAAWTNLQSLSLRFNQITSMGDAYTHWNQLTHVDMGENRLRGNLSSQALRRWNKLRTMSFLNNRELGVDAPLLTPPNGQPYWPHLQDLSISITRMELDLTYCSADNLPHIRTIDANQAALVGVLPTTLGTLTHLELLNTMNPVQGRFTGTIPTEIGLLSDSLALVSLDASGIAGTLPTHLGQLTQLRVLTLSMNAITGTLPTEMGQLQNLREFSIVENPVTGTIPTELGACTNLHDLTLELTKLTGSMPAEVCQLATQTTHGFFNIGANCAITAETTSARQVYCDCCTICYGM